MNKEKFTNATIFYTNRGEHQEVFCTNKNFTKTYNRFKKCSWIEIIDIVKYNFSE